MHPECICFRTPAGFGHPLFFTASSHISFLPIVQFSFITQPFQTPVLFPVPVPAILLHSLITNTLHSIVPPPSFPPPSSFLPRPPSPLPPPLPPPRMLLLHLLRLYLILRHHAHKKLTAPKPFRQLHSRPLIRVLFPQLPHLLHLTRRHAVRLLIGCAQCRGEFRGWGRWEGGGGS